MEKKKNIRHWKEDRKEIRVTVRFSEPLYTAIAKRAYQEDKTVSAVIIEAARTLLDFKKPLPDNLGKK
jgi:predicted DNA binding CopG/RHH family protein